MTVTVTTFKGAQRFPSQRERPRLSPPSFRRVTTTKQPNPLGLGAVEVVHSVCPPFLGPTLTRRTVSGPLTHR